MEMAQAGTAATGFGLGDVLQASCLPASCGSGRSLPGSEPYGPVPWCHRDGACFSALRLPWATEGSGN